METLKKYLNAFSNFYEKYLIMPIILSCALAVVYHTINYDLTEVITWSGLMIINLINLYFKCKTDDIKK
tara:strand:+ start:263 stop:469 length:207 start_codon:yes stop_codon:yes gene_type:complete